MVPIYGKRPAASIRKKKTSAGPNGPRTNTSERSVAHIREQRDLTCALYGYRELALVPCTCAGHPAGEDLSSLGDEFPELSGVLIIDNSIALRAEGADLPAALLTVI